MPVGYPTIAVLLNLADSQGTLPEQLITGDSRGANRWFNQRELYLIRNYYEFSYLNSHTGRPRLNRQDNLIVGQVFPLILVHSLTEQY